MQKQMYTYFICLSLILSACIPSYSQNIDSLLGIAKQADPQEKIYIHFDKNYYNPGETIWFKAYIFDGLERAQFSKNFYAELVDEGGAVLNRFTAPIGDASSAGSFDLPATFSKNVVYFRAYTVAMLNGDSNFVYVKGIPVITSTKATKPKAPPVVTLSFLPEGGEMIAGLTTTLAFKAIDANGVPVNVKGYIKASDGNKEGDFVSVHDGMGWFHMTPREGQTYTAVWKDATGKENNTALWKKVHAAAFR
jgi:hypothetical protein